MGRKWIPLESNPDVINDYLGKLGVLDPQYTFCDVYGLDQSLLEMVPKPVKAIVMCFPISDETDAAAKQVDDKLAAEGLNVPPKLFYLKQTIGNACGTIAILHSICNNTEAFQFTPGSFLSEFITATADMDPQARGKFLEDPPQGGPDIEAAHQGCTCLPCCGPSSSSLSNTTEDMPSRCIAYRPRRPRRLRPRRVGPDGTLESPCSTPGGSTSQPRNNVWWNCCWAAAADGDTAPPDEDENINLHFVAFVCVDGGLWELDGRRGGPVPHGPSSPDTLLSDSAAVILKLIANSPSLNFSLLALAPPEAP